MFIHMLLKEKRVAQLFTLVIFLVLALIFLVITYFLQSNADSLDGNEITVGEYNLVRTEKMIISNKINRRASDVFFIADSLEFGGVEHAGVSAIERLWIAFSNRNGIFDQIRYIDKNGNEKIRVNYGADGAYAVAQADLQNKADRAYFSGALVLKKNEVYISALDLNVENGQIELPIKPTLRLATPYFDDEGSLGGIVVLNYDAEDMLSQVRSVAASGAGEVFLLNRDGYYLYNSADRETEWAFMYDGREGESFAAAFPEEWEAITAGVGDGFLQTEAGTFTYTAVSPEKEVAGSNKAVSMFCAAGLFYIVSYIDAASEAGTLLAHSLPETLGRVVVKYLSIYFLLTGIAFVLAALIAVGRAQRKEVWYNSQYDSLTGVYNRRTGYMKLNDLRRDAAKKGCRISVCFIDINGLKEVNDRLGHDAGDELIQSVTDTIQGCIRNEDFVARLGGDEFLIVFDRLDAAGSEAVWKRIVEKLELINAGEHRAYLISVSHGIGNFNCDETVSTDEIIGRADTKMYEEKRAMRKGLNVIRGRQGAV